MAVTYSSRRQSDEFVAAVKKKGWRSGISFGQRADPCVGLFAKVMSVFEPDYTTYNVTVLSNVPGLPKDSPPPKDSPSSSTPSSSGHHPPLQNLYIATDTSSMQRISPSTLAPLGPTSQTALHPSLKGPASCAHAQRDPATGDLFNYNLDFASSSPTYRVFRVSAATGQTEVLATFTAPAAYIHSFFLSRDYVVLCVPSSHYRVRGLAVVWERNVVEALEEFDEARRCCWIVIDRRHGKGVVARFSTDAGFFFHSVNAFEEMVRNEEGKERESLVVEYVGYENLDIIRGLYYDVILDRDGGAKKYWIDEQRRFETGQASLIRERFVLPTTPSTNNNDHSASAQRIFSIPNPHSGDLPTINPSLRCLPHRFVWGLPNRGLNTVVDCVCKTDVLTRETLIWAGPQGHLPGEPVFVGRPGAEEEDDGVLLTVVVDCVGGKGAYLLCLDARRMEEVGRAEMGFTVGMGFHGVHIGCE